MRLQPEGAFSALGPWGDTGHHAQFTPFGRCVASQRETFKLLAHLTFSQGGCMVRMPYGQRQLVTYTRDRVRSDFWPSVAKLRAVAMLVMAWLRSLRKWISHVGPVSLL